MSDLSPCPDTTETRLGRGALAGISAILLVGLLMGSTVGGRAVQPGQTRGVEATVVREIAATFQRAARRMSSPDNHRPAAVAVRRSGQSEASAGAARPRVMRVEAHVPRLVQVTHLDLPPPARS
jgi:hypothetical protein